MKKNIKSWNSGMPVKSDDMNRLEAKLDKEDIKELGIEGNSMIGTGVAIYPDATSTAKGVVLLGVEGGAAKHEDIMALEESLNNKVTFEINGTAMELFKKGDRVKGKKRGDFIKLPNPSTLPTSRNEGLVYSPDGKWVVMGCETSPFLAIFDTTTTPYTKLANPTTLPTSKAYCCAFSPDGIRLAVAHDKDPYITIYDTTVIPFVKIENPATLPTGTGRGCSFNRDGTRLAVAHNATPYITIYDTTMEPYVKLPNPNTLPTSNAVRCAFNPDGTKLAVINHGSSPFITIYDTITTPYTKLANPTTMPSYPSCLSWNLDGTRLVVSHSSLPYITIYDTTIVPYTKIADPLLPLTRSLEDCSYSPDGTMLVGVYSSSPGIVIFNTTKIPYIQVANPTILPDGTKYSYCCAFNPDSTRLAITHRSSPYITFYDVPPKLGFYKADSQLDLTCQYFGFAKEDVAEIGDKYIFEIAFSDSSEQKANIDSPIFTGIPMAPTVSSPLDNQVATAKYVNNSLNVYKFTLYSSVRCGSTAKPGAWDFTDDTQYDGYYDSVTYFPYHLDYFMYGGGCYDSTEKITITFVGFTGIRNGTTYANAATLSYTFSSYDYPFNLWVDYGTYNCPVRKIKFMTSYNNTSLDGFCSKITFTINLTEADYRSVPFQRRAVE